MPIDYYSRTAKEKEQIIMNFLIFCAFSSSRCKKSVWITRREQNIETNKSIEIYFAIF